MYANEHQHNSRIAGQPALLPLPAPTERLLGVYWRPNPQFFSELGAYLKGHKVLEIFAGNGYLAGLLAAEGIDIVSTTSFSSHDAHDRGMYHRVEEMSAENAVLAYQDSRDLLLVCWPTVTPAVLRAAMLWGTDQPIVFIGEMTDYTKDSMGGGCATDEFFEHFKVTHRFTTYRGNRLESAVVGHMVLEPQSLGR